MMTLLFNHDIKFSYKPIIAINLLFSITIITLAILIRTIGLSDDILSFVFIIALALLSFVLVRTTFTTMFNSLFSKIGYTTLLIPIKTEALITTKILPHLLWWLITIIQVFVTLFISGLIAQPLANNEVILLDLMYFALKHPDLMVLLLVSHFLTLILVLIVCFLSTVFVNIGPFRELKLFFAFILAVIFAGILLFSRELLLIFPNALYINENYILVWGNIRYYQSNLQANIPYFSFNYVIYDILYMILLFILTRYLFRKKLEFEHN